MKQDGKLSYSIPYAAYIPCYKDGNSVKVIDKDGQTAIINKGIKWVIKKVVSENGMDISTLKQSYSGYVGRKNLIPLALGLDKVLIPVKVRKTIGVNDGSYAFINLPYIKEVSGDKSAVITLTCGIDITCLENKRTIKHRIKMANLVKERFASMTLEVSTLKEELPDIYEDCDKTVTKSDFILLIYEIIKLRNYIERQNAVRRIGGGYHGEA